MLLLPSDCSWKVLACISTLYLYIHLIDVTFTMIPNIIIHCCLDIMHLQLHDCLWTFSLQNTMPARIKKIHHYNESPLIDAFIALFKPFISKKIYDRVSTNSWTLIYCQQISRLVYIQTYKSNISLYIHKYMSTNI